VPFHKHSHTPDDLPGIAHALIRAFPIERVFLFDGPMGSGKTTLIKSICRELGFDGETSGPTFSIVQEYNNSNLQIFHFDLYRLKNSEQLLDIGFEDYLHSGAYIFIEWPDLAKEFLSGYPKVIVRIELTKDGREINAYTSK